MKVKAVYRSKVKNRQIIIGSNVFVNNKPTVVEVDENELKTLKGVAKQDWFDILDIYGENVPPVKAVPVEGCLVTEEESAMENTVVEEAPVAETPVEEVTEPTAEEAPVEEAEPEKKATKSRKSKKTEE